MIDQITVTVPPYLLLIWHFNMKKPDIWKLVLGRLLPAKSEFSRDDWRTYIQRYLLPEIQTETLRF